MNSEQHGDQAQAKPTTDVHSYVHSGLLGLPIFARELLAGGLAGGLAKTAVAPLERTKIILQTRGGNITVAGVLQHIWVTEGLPGLFRGNTASVLRIVPYAAIHFGSYEYFRRAVVQLAAGASYKEQQQQQQHHHHHSHPVWDLLAGSASGAAAVLATYPLDLVRTRLAWATEAPPSSPPVNPSTTTTTAAAGGGGQLPPPRHHHHHHHPGIWSMLASTAREEGFAALYRGVTPTLLGILPYAGLKFYVYQSMKNHYRAWVSNENARTAAAELLQQQHHQQQQQQQQQQQGEAGSLPNTWQDRGQLQGSTPQQQQQQSPEQQQKLPIGMTLLFGGVAGLVAQTVTYPLDVIRRQMQVDHLRQQQANPVDVQFCNASSSSNSSTHPVQQPVQQKNSSSVHSPPQPLAARLSSRSIVDGLRVPGVGSGNAGCYGSLGQLWQQQTVVISAVMQHAGPPAAQQHLPPCTPDAPQQHQLQRLVHSYGPATAPRLTTLAVTRKLLAAGGVRGLFRGLSINYMKVVPSTAIGFSVYDALKAYLGLTSTL